MLSKNIKEILSLIIVLATIIYIFLTTFMPVKTADSQGLIAMIGFAGSVIGFWLGGLAEKYKGKTNETTISETKEI